MSTFNSKANYHPVSQLAGHLPNGSYMLPGNGYYSVEGRAPRLQLDHSQINEPKYKHSQSYRIDPIHTLLSLKEESTLTRYHNHNPPVEMARDRYVFVPKFIPREEPNELAHAGFTQLKRLAEDRSEYRLNGVAQLPDTDYHVLPEKNLNDEAYRIYKAEKPYDMMVLRETKKFNPTEQDIHLSRNFVSASSITK